MAKKFRRRIKMILLAIVCLFVVYYTYIIIATHHIMVDIKKIENGYENNNPAYERFESEDEGEVYEIKRYFTWCWGNRGAIWITFKYSYLEDGKMIAKGRNYTKLIIEKREGKWKAVRTEWAP